MLFFLLGVVAVHAQDRRIVYLEYAPGEDPLRSIVVNWITDADDANPELEYREDGDSNWIEVDGSDYRIPISGKNSGERRNSVLITGLTPGTSYQVRVNEEVEKFRTPPSNSNNFRFIVGGDMYDGPAETLEWFKAMSRKAAATDPYFAVVGGDWANANADPDVAPQRWRDLMEDWYETMKTSDSYLIPIIAVMGNNDVPNDYGDGPEDATFFNAYFTYPGFQGYGVLDFGDFLRIITLNTEHTVPIEGEQTEWLEARLSEVFGAVEHVIPVYHTPAYPSQDSPNSFYNTLVRENWTPLFENYGVEYAFEHDNHTYKKIESINGVTYMGDGAWGVPPRMPFRLASLIYLDEYAQVNNVHAIQLNSDDINVTTLFYLKPPIIQSPSNTDETRFTANWSTVNGVDRYRLSLSTDDDFDDFVSGYGNIIVNGQNSSSYTFDNLQSNRTYYYRVRAEITSNVDNVINGDYNQSSIRISSVDPDESTIVADKNQVVANGDQASKITVTLRDEDGFEIPGVKVDLNFNISDVDQEIVNEFTDSKGEAKVLVRRSEPARVTFTAVAERPSGNVELSDELVIEFVPESPVALTATDVENRSFTANWEMVEGVDHYYLDVSTEEDFESFVSGYQNLDVGLTTSYEVSNINPGTVYYYRVRAEKGDLTGKNSEIIDVTTFPDVPVLNSTATVAATKFNVSWQVAAGAQEYILDVSSDEDFSNFVSGYKELNIGSQLSYDITGLAPGNTYYYRVRSRAFNRLSENSSTVEVSTAEIGRTESEVISEQLRVLANGEQENTITIILRSNEGISLEGEEITLASSTETSEIESIQSTTDENGQAIFSVASNNPGSVIYTAFVEGIYEIGDVSIEFLPNEGVLRLGSNYPNPFKLQTTIPVTVPERQRIVITISNILGASLKTIIDEELEPGYYEIPVDLSELASGVYFYRLMTEDEMKTKKMLMVR
jgi:hypothetical protein